MRFLAGLLGLGISVGSLLGSYIGIRFDARLPDDPLIDEYVHVVSVLYAKGESLALAKERLARLGVEDHQALLREIARRQSPADEALAAAGDTEGVLRAVAARAAPPSPGLARSVIASGRGGIARPTPATGPAGATIAVLASNYPASGVVPLTKADAVLRAEPSLSARSIEIVPKGSEILLLAVERGEAVDGGEDRWYKAKYGEATGYVYFNLVEQLP